MSAATRDKENQPPRPPLPSSTGTKRRLGDSSSGNVNLDVFTTRGRRKQLKSDPLIHYGRHFGRTVRTFCRIHTLITQGIARTMQLELERISFAELSSSEQSEHKVYQSLVSLVPGLEERLNTSSNEELIYMADMLTKGVSTARSDDTKTLKAAVIDWITPPNGHLSPPLSRNVKTDRGFFHDRTGELLCPVNLDWGDEKIRRDLRSGQLIPSGDMWPRFLYRGFRYDPENPWDGLLRSTILVNAYKHVFTSPSSVGQSGDPNRATRSGNARLHGMKAVTAPSLAYIATQVRFSLGSTSTFSRSDTVMDSEYFYHLFIDLLDDPEECEEVDDLIKWWNQQIFPVYVSESRAVHEDSVIAKIKERQRQMLDDPEDPGSPSSETGPEEIVSTGSQTG